MNVKEDWLLRQIESVTFSLAKIIFNKERPVYEITDAYLHADADELHKRLMALLADSKINEAEDLLFDAIDPYDSNYLLLALDFYAKLNEYDDNDLKQCNFSRDEVYDGLMEVKKLFGLNMF
jgi:archaellum biogenesis ATPase FlaH